MRHTESSMRAALALLNEHPHQRHWGYQLKQQTGLASGVLYPIMKRWVTEGWVWQRWEDPEFVDADRAPRRYIDFTLDGREAMQQWVTEARDDRRFSHLFGGHGEST